MGWLGRWNISERVTMVRANEQVGKVQLRGESGKRLYERDSWAIRDVQARATARAAYARKGTRGGGKR
jgi:hypothetical protein